MTTLREIGEHLGISHKNVSKDLQKMGVKDWQNKTLDEIRLLYLARLRAQASKYEAPGSKVSLIDVRIEKEQIEKKLLELKLAKESGQLVDLDQLYPVQRAIFLGCKEKILGLATVIKSELDAIHGIDIDLNWLEDLTESTLEDLSKYIEQYANHLDETTREQEIEN